MTQTESEIEKDMVREIGPKLTKNRCNDEIKKQRKHKEKKNLKEKRQSDAKCKYATCTESRTRIVVGTIKEG